MRFTNEFVMDVAREVEAVRVAVPSFGDESPERAIRRHLDIAHSQVLEIVLRTVKRNNDNLAPAFDLRESLVLMVRAFAHLEVAMEVSVDAKQ